MHVCMHKHPSVQHYSGIWGHAPPGNFQKLDSLRLLLRPFWDRSRAILATWLVEYCIQFLAVHDMHLLTQLTSDCHDRGLQNSRWGDSGDFLNSCESSGPFRLPCPQYSPQPCNCVGTTPRVRLAITLTWLARLAICRLKYDKTVSLLTLRQ